MAPSSNPLVDLTLELLITVVVIYLLFRLFRAFSSASFSDLVAPGPMGPAPRRYNLVPVTDPCNHRYADLPLTDLYGHLYEHHFEVWNMLGGAGKRKEAPPTDWRAEHAAEHGVILQPR